MQYEIDNGLFIQSVVDKIYIVNQYRFYLLLFVFVFADFCLSGSSNTHPTKINFITSFLEKQN